MVPGCSGLGALAESLENNETVYECDQDNRVSALVEFDVPPSRMHPNRGFGSGLILPKLLLCQGTS